MNTKMKKKIKNIVINLFDKIYFFIYTVFYFKFLKYTLHINTLNFYIQIFLDNEIDLYYNETSK